MNLRELREARALTQQQIAERAKIRRATVSDIERGTVKPSARTIRALARVLRVSVRELTATN